MRYKTKNKGYIAIFFLLFFLVFTHRSEAAERDLPTAQNEVKAELKKVIEFTVKREGQRFVLENLLIDESFEAIGSISIVVPDGAQINMDLPLGWKTDNTSTASVIGYILDETSKNTPADVCEALKGLTITFKDEKQAKGEIKISVNKATISTWVDDKNVTHYYQFVPEIDTWLNAYNKAKSMTYKGLTGYLATVTSKAEHEYIFNSIAKLPGWLGGTRMVYPNGGKLLDEPKLPNSMLGYSIAKPDWYWADGPEAGSIFFTGFTHQNGTRPIGVYNAWNANQPDNWQTVGGEYVLQFAEKNSPNWNDLNNDYVGSNANRGFYVEYSAYEGPYGKQEENDENSHSAAIPQRVSVQYLSKDNNQPLADEVITIGDEFSIGDPYNTSAQFRKDIEGYERMDSVEIGQYSDEPQVVIYYYTKQQIVFHIQQVVLNTNSNVVIPEKAYAEIDKIDALNNVAVTKNYGTVNVLAKSLTKDADDYMTAKLMRELPERYYRVGLVVPEYYQYKGYVLTNENVAHQPSNLLVGFPTIDSNDRKEYWVTFYLQPMTTEPRSYSWGNQQMNLGTLE
ncbi:MucBP domain-containing protein [Isobaculum melis]|uniref:MucBP domain-containing protein n=1 Tax=Isobaculum melis TaxID=142588 RepID=A0A1H9SF45_9LACT|nr:MucBP domain-containing protein [Isobaculum melis]SER83632.1 MucBP domain-containing protein [Isobaculum melis]